MESHCYQNSIVTPKKILTARSPYGTSNLTGMPSSISDVLSTTGASKSTHSSTILEMPL